MKIILIVLDGLGDIPYKQLNNKTPLEYAKTPNLDFLAKNSKTGLLQPIKNIAPESGEAQFSILGQNLKDYPGRGPIEALSKNIHLKQNQIALRCNFAQIKNNKITSLREKIPSKKIIKKLNQINKDIKIIPTIDYRAIMVVNNAHLPISNTHPGYINNKNVSMAITPILKKKTCKGHKQTANKINNFIKQAEKILKNKTILMRGAGTKPKKIKSLKNWSLIASMPVELGLAKLLNMKILKRKNEIKQAIKTNTNVYVQIKGPDTYSHRGDLKGKIRIIEQIDKQLKPLKNLKNTIICITSDHSTPCKLKRHSKDSVPLLIYNNKNKDNTSKKSFHWFEKGETLSFSERLCKYGSLKTIQGKDLLKTLSTQ